jgi:endonuclease III
VVEHLVGLGHCFRLETIGTIFDATGVMTIVEVIYNMAMAKDDNDSVKKRSKRPKPIHHASEFGLDVLSGDDDMFRWFLLSFLFGKPIQSGVAARTWQLFIDRKLDTPWAILDSSRRSLVRLLDEGRYTRYDEVTARALQTCMQQLIQDYDGSLLLMLESSATEDEFSKRLQKLYGVGPKTAEIFMRETEEIFARRVE